MLKRLALSLACGSVLFAGPAFALDDSRIILRLGATFANAQGRLSAATAFNGTPIAVSQPYDFGSAKIMPTAEAEFRLGNRHRIIATYMRYEREQGATLQSDLGAGNLILPAGSAASFRAGADVASLVYDFAVLETQEVSLGLEAGAEYGRLFGHVGAQVAGQTFQAGDSIDGVAPVIGARLTAAPAAKWRFQAQGRYFDARWGNFGDIDGGVTNVSALVERRFSRNLGVHVGYELFRIDIKHEIQPGVVKLRHEFKGPMAGLTLAF